MSKSPSRTKENKKGRSVSPMNDESNTEMVKTNMKEVEEKLLNGDVNFRGVIFRGTS